jgi:hypothetical protein
MGEKEKKGRERGARGKHTKSPEKNKYELEVQSPKASVGEEEETPRRSQKEIASCLQS